MGKYDFVRDIMEELGVVIKIDSVKMKPGKPLAFGTKGNVLFFGLPGNPVSAMVAFSQFVRPALFKMSGAENYKKPEVYAVLEEDIKKKPERRHFIRGIFTIKDGVFHVKTTGNQGSGILKSMSEANCLIIAPEEKEILKKGESVIIQLTEHGEI
jgi:molybdopterin molybdotransferase